MQMKMCVTSTDLRCFSLLALDDNKTRHHERSNCYLLLDNYHRTGTFYSYH